MCVVVTCVCVCVCICMLSAVEQTHCSCVTFDFESVVLLNVLVQYSFMSTETRRLVRTDSPFQCVELHS